MFKSFKIIWLFWPTKSCFSGRRFASCWSSVINVVYDFSLCIITAVFVVICIYVCICFVLFNDWIVSLVIILMTIFSIIFARPSFVFEIAFDSQIYIILIFFFSYLFSCFSINKCRYLKCEFIFSLKSFFVRYGVS